jgi:hypothetical protein
VVDPWESLCTEEVTGNVGGIAHDTTQPESPPAKSKAADNNSTLISADVP